MNGSFLISSIASFQKLASTLTDTPSESIGGAFGDALTAAVIAPTSTSVPSEQLGAITSFGLPVDGLTASSLSDGSVAEALPHADMTTTGFPVGASEAQHAVVAALAGERDLLPDPGSAGLDVPSETVRSDRHDPRLPVVSPLAGQAAAGPADIDILPQHAGTRRLPSTDTGVDMSPEAHQPAQAPATDDSGKSAGAVRLSPDLPISSASPGDVHSRPSSNFQKAAATVPLHMATSQQQPGRGDLATIAANLSPPDLSSTRMSIAALTASGLIETPPSQVSSANLISSQTFQPSIPSGTAPITDQSGEPELILTPAKSMQVGATREVQVASLDRRGSKPQPNIMATQPVEGFRLADTVNTEAGLRNPAHALSAAPASIDGQAVPNADLPSQLGDHASGSMNAASLGTTPRNPGESRSPARPQRSPVVAGEAGAQSVSGSGAVVDTAAQALMTETGARQQAELGHVDRMPSVFMADGAASDGERLDLPTTNINANRTPPSLPQPSAGMQIALQIARSAPDGVDRFSLQLHPAELGSVDIQLTFEGAGRLSALITAERPETLELLQRDSRLLERSLGDSGLKLSNDGLNFSLKQDQQQHQPGQNFQEQAQSKPGHGGAGHTYDDASDAEQAPLVRQVGGLRLLDIET